MSTTGALILRLSDDLVLHVFSFLRAEMLARVCALSRRMCAIASEDLLWYGLLCEELGHGRLPGPSMSHVVGEWRRRWIAWRRLEVVGCETRSVQGEEEEVPQARFLHRAACPTGRLMYVFGGQGEAGEFNDMWVLDKRVALSEATAPGSPPRARRRAWRRVEVPSDTPAPVQRQSATLTAVGSQLLMFGGRWGESVFLNDAWLYDTLRGRWQCVHESEETYAELEAPPPRADQPCPRWAHSAVRFGRRVLVFGGSAPGRCFSDLHWFDLATCKWSRVAPEGRSPAQRSGHCACAVGDASMFVFGGNTTRASFNDLWEFQVDLNRWRPIKGSGAAPSGRVGHTITSVGSRLLVLGGREYATNQFDRVLHAFDTSTRRWSQVPLRQRGAAAGQGASCAAAESESEEASVPVLRTGHSTDAFEGKLLVFGGLCSDGSYLGDVTAVHLIEPKAPADRTAAAAATAA